MRAFFCKTVRVRELSAMAFNSSHLPDSICLFVPVPNASKSTSVYYQATLTGYVDTSHLAPMAVVANSLIMAGIWKNPSLRTPSYVLLAGLAFTEFCTGLVSQPLTVVHQLTELAGNRRGMFCLAGVVVVFPFFFLIHIFTVLLKKALDTTFPL